MCAVCALPPKIGAQLKAGRQKFKAGDKRYGPVLLLRWLHAEGQQQITRQMLENHWNRDNHDGEER
jgi:hypothetical protein